MQKHEAIGGVRGHGLLLGVETLADPLTRAPGHELINKLTDMCFTQGLNINQVSGPHTVWRIAPPLTISKSEIDQAILIIDRVFSANAPS